MLSTKSYIKRRPQARTQKALGILDDPILGLGSYALVSDKKTKKPKKSKNKSSTKPKSVKKTRKVKVVDEVLGKPQTKVVKTIKTVKTDIIPEDNEYMPATSTTTPADDWDSFLNDFNSSEPVIVTDTAIEEVPIATEQMPTISAYNTGDAMTKYIVGGDIVDMSLEQKVTFNDGNADSACDLCKAKLLPVLGMLVCSGCGVEAISNTNTVEEEYSTSAVNDCNVHSEGFLAFKVMGRGSYGLHRSMLKTCASYKKYRKSNTLKDMKNWNVHSKKHHIPKNVIREANDMFATIKEAGYVFRKDGKKGVISACLYYACYNNGISKTPSEIAQFSNIEEKFHSFGDRILHDLNELGVIEIPIKVAPITDYVTRYMTLLEIPMKYKKFVLELIARADKKHIHILHDSKNNTKCVGAIYMLIDRVPDLSKRITKEMIEKDCGISKTTFIRYYNVLCDHYKCLKKIFKRNGISMKSEWR